MMLGRSAASARNAARQMTMQAIDRMKREVITGAMRSQIESGALERGRPRPQQFTTQCVRALTFCDPVGSPNTGAAAGEGARAPALPIAHDGLASGWICER